MEGGDTVDGIRLDRTKIICTKRVLDRKEKDVCRVNDSLS